MTNEQRLSQIRSIVARNLFKLNDKIDLQELLRAIDDLAIVAKDQEARLAELEANTDGDD